MHNRFATAPSAALAEQMSDDADSMKKGSLGFPFCCSGAGEESRTLDLNLGKVALYQLSYSRIGALHFTT